MKLPYFVVYADSSPFFSLPLIISYSLCRFSFALCVIFLFDRYVNFFGGTEWNGLQLCTHYRGVVRRFVNYTKGKKPGIRDHALVGYCILLQKEIAEVID